MATKIFVLEGIQPLTEQRAQALTGMLPWLTGTLNISAVKLFARKDQTQKEVKSRTFVVLLGLLC